MKRFSFNPLMSLVTVALVLLCAGLAWAGVIDPVVAGLPLFGLAGAIKVRDGLEHIRTIKYTHSAATVTDTIYYLNGMILLAMNSVAENVENVFVCCGLIEYTKVSTEVWTGGQKIYWDPAAAKFTNVRAIGCILAGYAAEAAANPTATGFIVLAPEMRAASGPSHSVIAAGRFTTAGGDATETITVTGAVAGDIVVATLSQVGSTPRTILTAITGTDAVTVTLSGDPAADHKIDYAVLRAVI
jgi:predicted RecA/RadA family phage recombinase